MGPTILVICVADFGLAFLTGLAYLGWLRWLVIAFELVTGAVLVWFSVKLPDGNMQIIK
jgi:hypothetical protein